ncbi:MAG: nuclear transport factor 2 family protein [Acidiferrobacterales bacterium]
MGKRGPQDIVHAYLDAIEARDFARARTYLSDQNFSFRGPIASFDNADDFIVDTVKVGLILEGIERRKTFVDGNEVCDILNFRTRLSALTTTPVVQLATVANGKITSIEVFFDAHAYVKMFEP